MRHIKRIPVCWWVVCISVSCQLLGMFLVPLIHLGFRVFSCCFQNVDGTRDNSGKIPNGHQWSVVENAKASSARASCCEACSAA